MKYVMLATGLLYTVSAPAMEFIDTNACRSNEEINEAFDQRKTALNEVAKGFSSDMVNGVVIVGFLIKPDGSVKNIHLISSTVKNPEATAKVVNQAKKVRFKKSDCPDFSVGSYPIRIQRD
jgi:hypothetical protein